MDIGLDLGRWAVDSGLAGACFAVYSAFYRQCGCFDGYSASFGVGVTGLGSICAICAWLLAAGQGRAADVCGVPGIGSVLDGQSLLDGSDNYHRLGGILSLYRSALACLSAGGSVVQD